MEFTNIFTPYHPFFGYIAYLVALGGAYLNVKKNKNGFYVWLVSNMYFAFANAYFGNFPEVLLFASFSALNLYALKTWK